MCHRQRLQKSAQGGAGAATGVRRAPRPHSPRRATSQATVKTLPQDAEPAGDSHGVPVLPIAEESRPRARRLTRPRIGGARRAVRCGTSRGSADRAAMEQEGDGHECS